MISRKPYAITVEMKQWRSLTTQDQMWSCGEFWIKWDFIFMIFLVISFNCMWVYIPGDAGQVSNYIEEIFLWHFAKAWVLWESDDGGTIFPSPSYSTEKINPNQ